MHACVCVRAYCLCIVLLVFVLYGCTYICLQVDRQESAREQKRAEVLDSMKRLFPGVVSHYISIHVVYASYTTTFSMAD